MADEQNPMPEETRAWVRHPVPPEVLAAMMADFNEAEFAAEIQAVLDGRVKTYTMDEILAEIEADARHTPQA
jgi:hypothetical protein